MMQRAWALAGIFALLSLTGCLSTDEPPLPAYPEASSVRLADPGIDFSDVVVADHGAPFMHTIRQLHGGSHLLWPVGWNDLTDKLPPEAAGTGWGALGIWENYVCIAQFVGSGSIAIVDIADPTDPVVTAQTSDALTNGDCQFTHDGRFLFAGAYLGVANSTDAPGVPFAERGTPGGWGLNVWDVSDKENPVHVLFSNTGEYHTHHLHTDADGTIWVVQAYSGNIYTFDPESHALDLVNTVTPMVHDMWIGQHPITGKTLLFTGADRDGFVIYDFDDPANPVDLANWLPPEEIERAEGWHRQELSTVLIDGRAILVVSGETCGTGETRPYIVVDITDVSLPKTMGSWELPGTPVSTDPDAAHLCEFSSHEFSLYDGYLAVANYHAGVWLIDIGSEERLWDPVTLGYFIPAEEPALQGSAQDLTWPWNPFVWGTVIDERGYIIHGDFSSGLYVLKIPGVTQD